jgi:hypothetical protein
VDFSSGSVNYNGRILKVTENGLIGQIIIIIRHGFLDLLVDLVMTNFYKCFVYWL